jgi:predicted enzyme related to lactoylglutathione lyase
MARVLGVGGIFFKSTDPEKLSQWYAKTLGLPVETEWHGGSLAPGLLPEGSYTVWAPFKQDTSYFGPADQTFMINLVVDNVTEALAQVRQAGGQIVGEIEELEYGIFGWFLDPDGNKVELWAPSVSSG